MTENQPEDQILRSRERARSLANLGKRCGYGCFGAAVIVFLFHYYIEGSSVLTSITVALLIIGSVILAPAIILGYAANAADREDQGLPHGH